MTAQHLFCYQNQCNIYDVDAKLTKAPNWINDALLSFAMRYIETACFPKRKDLNFVSTYISYLLTYERDIEDITTAINANNIDQKRLLFFPINNNPYLTKVGGTHWSLLVYDDEEQKFYYFDSSRNVSGIRCWSVRVRPSASTSRIDPGVCVLNPVVNDNTRCNNDVRMAARLIFGI